MITDRIEPRNIKASKALILINEPITERIGKKIYCLAFLYKEKTCQRIISFLDSGADVSLIKENYLKKIFSNGEIDRCKVSTQNYDLKSFSNNRIEILYGVKLKMSFVKFERPFESQFLVIKDVQGAPSMLIGADIMQNTLLSISYVGSIENPLPEIRILKPKKQKVTSYFVNERQLLSFSLTSH